jgi:predicted nucleotidyltransferase
MNLNKKIINRSTSELKKILINRFGKEIELYLFGSVARNDFGRESDIDILALLPDGDDMNRKKEIIDLAYDIELKYNIVFGIVVCSTEFWRSEKAAVMPFHRNLQKEAFLI